MDTPWWQVHHGEVSKVFKGLRVRGAGSSQSNLAHRAMFGSGCLNSGAGALLMAQYYGAELIIMLGYDCKVGGDGHRHWHGSHPKGLGDAGMLAKWPEQFAVVSRLLKPLRVINASRESALECFERMQLEDALQVTR